MDTLLIEYEKTRGQLITWFGKRSFLFFLSLEFINYLIESVKETQRVTVDEIPMPELPSGSAIVEVPSTTFHDTPRSILKQKE